MRGTAIGSYCLLEQLGEGGMGTVWVAEHTLLGRRAAIKLLHQTFSTSETIVQRFFTEAKVIAAIAEPGIVQIFDFGVHSDGAPYIVMELLDGEGLDARLGRVGRLAPGDAIRIIRQVAISLAAAHGKGVIHRDLKPENLFLARDPAMPGGERVKVLDFGIAKLSGGGGKHKTRTGAVLGTPAYMSPEQCRAIGNIDHRTDVYSLGAVLFCLVTGRPPFEGEGAGDAIISHVRDQPPVPSSLAPGLPAGLDAVILRCLEKDPARRYQAMDELAAALDGIDASPRERAASAGIAGGIDRRPAAHGAAAAGGAATLPAHAITTISDAPGEVTSGRWSARRRWIGVAIGVAAALVVTMVIASGGSGGTGEGTPSAGSDPDPAGAAASAPAVDVPAAAVVPDAAAETAPAEPAVAEPAPAEPVPAVAEPPAPVAAPAQEPPADASISSAAARAVAPVDARPAPGPRPKPAQGTRDHHRDKEGTTRHGSSKAKTGSSGLVDHGD